MRKWILAVGVVAALSAAGCSSGGDEDASASPATTSASAEDEALHAEACDAYQRMGEKSLQISQAMDKAFDQSLSAAQRAEAKKRAEELASDKTPPSGTDECSGPTWDTYYADVKQGSVERSATAAAKTSVAETGVTNWKYLQSEHSKFLGMKCDSFTGADDTICIGLRNAGTESFVRDATNLPDSKARTDVVEATERMKDDYTEYQAKRCDIEPEGAACIGKSLEMELAHSTIVTIVNREAAAQ
ncbi:hypothetical protein A6410_05445 [Prescottella equi]|uniref:hypothetical protein n=1 Tax=Rhodococcus hoagii TaxID=43767 RepID=UPI0009BDBD7D|nr:hypothetical protein [Prescottella equi]OQQ31068.1 hypothetical protein A6410_05445 [Prescottella equi]